MKFLLAKTPEIIQKSLKDNNMQALYVDFRCHPIQLEKAVSDFIEKEKEQDNGVYVTYNTLALNYIPPDMVLWLEDVDSQGIIITPFQEVFKDWEYFETGDIFEIICYDIAIIFTPDKKSLQEGKVKYNFPNWEFTK